MKLEFKLLKINDENRLFKQLSHFNKNNEFVAVGEETIEGKEYFKVIQLIDGEDDSTGLKLIGGLKLDIVAYSIEKAELKPKGDGMGIDYLELEIPKEYLTFKLIETIQRLNE